MARRVWVLPPSWPSDPGEDNGGATPESGESVPHEDPQRLLVRLRAKRKARADKAGSEVAATPPDPSG
jgi:hypothetical protein